MAFGTDAANRMGSPQALGGQFYNKTIDQSLRFEDGDTAFLKQTSSSGNRRKFTLSWWWKNGNTGVGHCFLMNDTTDASGRLTTGVLFGSDNSLRFRFVGSGGTNLGNNYTTALFRDVGTWYHFVVAVDTDADAVNDRLKMYANGVRLTEFSTQTDITKNQDLYLNNGEQHYVGAFPYNSEGTIQNYADGYLAEMHYVDGTQYDVSYFGESKNGVWIPKQVSGVTYGTNGFHLDFADSGDIGNDVSGNGNDYTPNNLAATDVVSDSPTNNYPTFNPLDKSTTVTLSEGNLKYTYNSRPNSRTIRATQSLPSFGKYYWEMKNEQANTTAGRISGGIVNQPSQGGAWDVTAYSDADHIDYSYGGGLYSNSVSLGVSLSWYNNERAAVAVDCDNGKFWFGKVFQNGSTTWFDSSAGETGNPVTGVNPTVNDLISITNYVPYMSWHEGGSGSEVFSGSINFGQETFLGTIPSGYKTLSNFNLPEPVAVNPRNDSIENSYFYTVLYEGNGGGQRVGQFLPLNEVKTVNNAIRFEDGDSAYLSRTPGSAGNQRTWTWSSWIKRGNITLGSTNHQTVFSCGTENTQIRFHASDDTLDILFGGSTDGHIRTSQVFEDTNNWFHIVVAVDTTQSTDSDRCKVYINGTLVTNFTTETYPIQDYDTGINNNELHSIGRSAYDSNRYFDGYIADAHLVDGQSLTPSYFGQTDPSTEQWIPKTFTGNHGQNGFHLEFLNNEVGADSANTNSFTPVNLTTANTVIDTPTKNWDVWDGNYGGGDKANPLASATLSNGNLEVSLPTNSFIGNNFHSRENGKWYAEFYLKTVGSTNGEFGWGWIDKPNYAGTTAHAGVANKWGIYYHAYSTDHVRIYDGTAQVGSNINTTISAGDILQLALDVDNGKLYCGINNSWISVDDLDGGDPSAGTNPTFTIAKEIAKRLQFYLANGTSTDVYIANFGQDSSFAGEIAAAANTDGLGAEFKYTPPTGFKALNVDNFPPKGTKGTARRKQPALTWIKNRDATDSHVLVDQVRGLSNGTVLFSNLLHQANTNVNSVQKFLPGGFQIGNDVKVNTANESYVAWNWAMHDDVINAGLVYNTDGDIPSYVIADKRLGFSILKYTHDGTNASTVGHGLSQTPEWIINKQISHSASNWRCYHKSLTSGYNIQLNLDHAQGTAADIYPSAPSASVFTPGNGDSASGRDFISYCWHSVEGFSAFGSYTGNGSTNGTYVHLGFKPAFVLIKRINTTDHWMLFDNQRGYNNQVDNALSPSLNYAESSITGDEIDLLSNGFKPRSTNAIINGSSSTYIYIAFAEQPFKYANAR